MITGCTPPENITDDISDRRAHMVYHGENTNTVPDMNRGLVETSSEIFYVESTLYLKSN